VWWQWVGLNVVKPHGDIRLGKESGSREKTGGERQVSIAGTVRPCNGGLWEWESVRRPRRTDSVCDLHALPTRAIGRRT